jgi:hypothetical protein
MKRGTAAGMACVKKEHRIAGHGAAGAAVVAGAGAVVVDDDKGAGGHHSGRRGQKRKAADVLVDLVSPECVVGKDGVARSRVAAVAAPGAQLADRGDRLCGALLYRTTTTKWADFL